MRQALIAAAILILWAGCAGVIGWKWRDDIARADQAERDAVVQGANVQHVQAARDTDHGNAQAGAKEQRNRATRSSAVEANFKTIEGKASEYAKANPDPVGCVLDGDGMRAWTAANAGGYIDPEPVHISGPAGSAGK